MHKTIHCYNLVVNGVNFEELLIKPSPTAVSH